MKDWALMNRREFLNALGAAYGSIACAWLAPPQRFLDYSTRDGEPDVEKYVNALCPMCPGGCGLSVRVVHGCAVGIRGNTSHPINRGGLCSRACAALQDLYNPDRVRRPLKRAGERGSGEWVPVDWDAAIGEVVDRLGSIRNNAGPERLCVVIGRDRGVMRAAWRRFMRAYGSPNLVDAFPDDNLSESPAVLATHGVRERIGFDLARSAFVLSFSSGWLDAHWSTEQAAWGFAEFRRGRPNLRPRWIHVEPRSSITAIKADEWIPIRPGTEGILALGIAHVMIREGLYDREFVERRCHGFENWTDETGVGHLGFRQMVLQEYSPATVQSLTDVPEGDVFRLGREFSMSRPAVALGFDGGGCGFQATYHRMAIHCLNALAGSIDVPGGVTVFRELSLLEGDLETDETSARGLARPRLDGPKSRHRLSESAVDLLAESLSTGRPYPAEALILADVDPVFSLADGRRFAQAISAVPFVVAIDGYHNDSNRHADLILPSIHGLHRWNFNIAHTLRGHPVVTVSQPVIPPLEEMRGPFALLRTIAGALGEPIHSALPWATEEEVVRAAFQELFQAGKGAACGPANEESWAQILESRGWRAPFSKSFDSFFADVLAGGGWTDPIYFHHEWNRVFRNPSGRFAFHSKVLEGSFEREPEAGTAVDLDRRCLPDCRVSGQTPNATYPLELYVYPLPNLVSVASANLPWLNQIAGAYMFQKWCTWVEIPLETAGRFGIEEGDSVTVETTRGRLTLHAKIFPGLHPGMIAIPFGFGHKTGGRWCRGIGENPSALVEPRIDPISGRAVWNLTRASIRRA